jgi:arylsulfatase
MFGNRAIYHEGWVAGTRHNIPWLLTKNTPLEDDVWELYHVDKDFTQANNLAKTHPEKLEELKEIFEEEAIKNKVYPIDDRRSERFNAAIAGRPDLIGGRKSLKLYEGMTGIMENAFLNIMGKSYRIRAKVDVPQNVDGVIISQAGRFGGWSLYAKNGVPAYEYNFFGLEKTNMKSPAAIAPGKHEVVYEFHVQGKEPGAGGKGILFVDGKQVAEKSIPRTQPFAYSADEGVDVGLDGETVVSEDYKEGDNAFAGKIEEVVVEILP